MNTLRTLTITVLLMMVVAAVAAADITREPGYFDLEWIEIPEDADEIQDIDLSAMLTEVAAKARNEGDDELAKALAMVRSVRVKAFSLEEADPATARVVDRMTDELKSGGWNRLIYVKDGDETVTVSSMHQDGLMVGLVVVAYEPGDGAVFVNVVGDLDMATLLGMAGEFDLDDLDEYMDMHGHGHDHDDDDVHVEKKVRRVE